MAVVYRHIRLDKNEVFYVGIGKTEARAYKTQSRNSHWKNITNKTDYRVDILFDDLTWDEACKKEIEFIEIYGRKDLRKGTLVNLTNGGEGKNGTKHSEATKKKLSEIKLGKTHNRGNNLMGVSKPNQKRRLLGSGKGYYFDKRSNKFISKIFIDGKNKHLGSYDNEIDAHNAYVKFYNEKIINTNDK
jgi:hypothetical protein